MARLLVPVAPHEPRGADLPVAKLYRLVHAAIDDGADGDHVCRWCKGFRRVGEDVTSFGHDEDCPAPIVYSYLLQLSGNPGRLPRIEAWDRNAT